MIVRIEIILDMTSPYRLNDEPCYETDHRHNRQHPPAHIALAGRQNFLPDFLRFVFGFHGYSPLNLPPGRVLDDGQGFKHSTLAKIFKAIDRRF